jgi:ribonuclease PH
MSRHIVDRPKPRDDTSRARAFLKIQRDVRPNAATQRLQREPRRHGVGRLKQFLRIERGRSA